MSTHSLGNDSHFLEFFFQFLSVDVFVGVINNLLSEMSNPGEIVANSSERANDDYLLFAKKNELFSAVTFPLWLILIFKWKPGSAVVITRNSLFLWNHLIRLTCLFNQIDWKWTIFFDNTIPPRHLCWNCDRLKKTSFL